MAWSAALLAYVVVQFIAFLFVLVATPIDMFRARGIVTFFDDQCVTLWGVKDHCMKTSYRFNSDELWLYCPARRDRFRAAQVLAIISIVVYGAAFVLGFIMLFCCPWLRWVCVALNIVGAGTLCFVWAAMVVAYNRNEGVACDEEKLFYIYGAGFVLFALAWGMDVLNIVFLLLPMRDGGSDEARNGTENKSED